MDFPINLNPELDIPLWKQLSEALCQAIESGRLSPGEPLPPTRHLAQLLNVSRDTVVRSYEELIGQGYLEATPGSGTFVRHRPSAGLSAARPEDESPAGHARAWLTRLSAYGIKVMQFRHSGAESGDQPDLNFGAAPPDLLPSTKWRELLARRCNLQESARLLYEADSFGCRSLREALASYLRRSKAINCTSDQIALFSDSQHGLDMLARLLLNPGDVAVVEDPCYGGAREVFRAYGARLHPIPVDEQGLVTSELEGIEERPKLIYVTPSHQDPTGVVMSLERRQQLLAWARRRDVVIVEDAFDSDYRYGSEPMPALKGLDDTAAVLYLYSFWKILYPLSTAGCLVLPHAVTSVFEQAKLRTHRNFPVVEHYALADFIVEGHLERHIRKTRSIYTKRRQALMFALSRLFHTAVSYLKESAGLHLLVRFSLGIDDHTILKCAREAGLPLVSTSAYYLDEPVSGEFLIPFAIIPEEGSAELVGRFAQLLGA